MSSYELDNTDYLMFDSHYGVNPNGSNDNFPRYNDEDIQNGPTTVYSNESIKNKQINPHIYRVAIDTSQDNVKGKESFNTVSQSQDQLKLKLNDQKFVEQQSKNMLQLVEIIDAYQKENNDLKNKINEKEQVCKLQLDYANSTMAHINEPTNLKQYIKIEIFVLVLLLTFIIYFYLL